VDLSRPALAVNTAGRLAGVGGVLEQSDGFLETCHAFVQMHKAGTEGSGRML
jgi:hypothetical protein